ncbi:RNA polymerase sigma factor [Cohnella cellulosilytica]|uniref:RNA polymerase sigma factor n=1 Tax=Cohnella cellulosilytica TaxID=986710 RepID=A0ABW2FG69_9BACL
MTAAKTESVEEICLVTWEAVYRFVYFKVQNREEAEDVTQEAYVKAFPYLQKGKVKPEKYVSFLKKIAHNILRDSWRKQKRRGMPVSIDSLDLTDHAAEDPADSSARRQLIEQGLARLKEEQRTVIEMRIMQGYSVADTARRINKSEEAVRVLQHRALHTLSGILADIDHTGEANTYE